MSRAIDTLRREVGPEAELLIERHDTATGQHFRELARLIGQTGRGDTIRIMTHHAYDEPEWEPTSGELYHQAREDYFRVLLAKAREGVVYRRVLCFNDLRPNAALPVRFVKPHLRAHLLELLKLDEDKCDVEVRKASAVLAADVLVISDRDRDRLAALTVDARVPGQHIHTAGALIAHDPPNAHVVAKLRKWWEQINKKGYAISAEELKAPESMSGAG